MPVNSEHRDYTANKKKWCLVRSIVDNNAQNYIRTVDETDPERSKQYKSDAILTNFTALTQKGLTGLIFLKDPQITLPPQLDYLNEDATGSELSLTQLAQQVVGDLLETGRYGILVDFPRAETDLTVVDIENGFVPRLIPYTTEAIVNWRCEKVNGKDQLVLVVLKEEVYVEGIDEFDYICQDQYRVLQLIDGIYVQSIYNTDLEFIEATLPQKADGTNWDRIPFVFIGAENNDTKVDNPPLYDLAVLNLGHYRNSADFEESVFVTGQPTVIINVGDMDALQWKELNNGKFKYGSRGGTIVGLGGNAQLLQANPNQLAGQAMKDKEAAAVSIGARLISPPGGRETAEAARIRYSSQNSALYTLTKNVEEAIELALEICCGFALDANPDEVEFTLNDQFYEDGADVNLIAQAIMMLDRNAITVQELRNYISSSGAGLIDESVSLDTLTLEGDFKNPVE